MAESLVLVPGLNCTRVPKGWESAAAVIGRPPDRLFETDRHFRGHGAAAADHVVQHWLRLQTAYDLAQVRAREEEIVVRRLVPKTA